MKYTIPKLLWSKISSAVCWDGNTPGGGDNWDSDFYLCTNGGSVGTVNTNCSNGSGAYNHSVLTVCQSGDSDSGDTYSSSCHDGGIYLGMNTSCYTGSVNTNCGSGSGEIPS